MNKSGDGKKNVLFESELEREAARIAGAVIGRTANGVMDTLSDVFGGLVGDAIREWRTRNLIGRLAHTAEILKARGVVLDKARALPMGEAYAMFEEASKQDDPTIAEMWAALLANAMDPSSRVRIDPAFVAVLRVIGSVEAHTLRFIYEFNKERARLIETGGHTERSLTLGRRKILRDPINDLLSTQKEKHLLAFPSKQIEVALLNLVRERCLYIPAATYSGLVRTKPTKIQFRDVEMVNPASIEDALNTLAGSIEEYGGRPDMFPSMEVPRSSPVQLSFDVTEFGLRLLRACEP